MIISERLKKFREFQNLSQGDIEERTGLLRCYVSRVENGHTTPSVETLEKFARALNVPIYQLFYDGEEIPKRDDQETNGTEDWASVGPGQRIFWKTPLSAQSDKRIGSKTVDVHRRKNDG
jgi:transcriptional regulator with XRE-family HTH domain